MIPLDLFEELDLLLAAAKAAGDAAVVYFRAGAETSARISYKEGDSPVSEADHAANDALEQHLRRSRPSYQWISEETADSDERLASSHVFVVDPIDGTRAFIAGKPEWCVSVALIVQGEPVAGVIHAPCLGVTYRACKGGGAYSSDGPIRVSTRQGLDGALCAGPKSLVEKIETVASVSLHHMPRVPSLALRLAYVAAGQTDLGLATTGAHDWDVAAADVLLREAGGVLLDKSGQKLVYNQLMLRRGMLCAGPQVLASRVAAAIG